MVNVFSRPDFSICGAMHVKLHFFICCLTLCCNAGSLFMKGVGKVGCSCHESMEVGESSIAALILNLSARGKGVVSLKCPCTPWERAAVPSKQEPGRFLELVCMLRRRKNLLPLSGIILQFLGCPALQLSYYTNHAIPTALQVARN